MNQSQESSSSPWHHGDSYVTPPNSTDPFLTPLSSAMDTAISVITACILFITMVSLGCTMEISKIKEHLVKPKGVAIAALAQYGIMPLAAFSLAKILRLAPIEAVVVLICGCCPGGNLSNIFALALQGDMNLSIVMTSCSTLLALGMMPLLLYLYCQAIPNAVNVVPFTGIALALVMTLVPCFIGVAINHRAPRYSPVVTKVGMGILLVFAVVISVLAGLTIGETVWLLLSPRLIATASILPLTGYVLGYLLSTVFRLNSKCRRTISMETGCQNIQLCSAILKVAFPPEVIGPLYLFPLTFILFQAGEALVFVALFRCYQRLRPPAEDKQVYLAVDLKVETVKGP